MGLTTGILSTYKGGSKPKVLSKNYSRETIGIYTAMAMVNDDQGIKIGGTWKIGASVTAVPITKDNIVDVLFDASCKGVAYWIDNCNVSENDTDRKLEKMVLANYAGAKSTNITDAKFAVQMYESENVDFENYLGGNPEDDVFLFTNTTFLHIPFTTCHINYSAIKAVMNDQNSTKLGALSYEFMYRSTAGKLNTADNYGYTATLYKSYPKFTFTESTLVNLTLQGTFGKYTRVKRATSATLSEIPVLVTTYQADYILLDGETDKELVGSNIVYDSVNNKISILGATPAGTYNLKLVGINSVGVKGEKCYQVIIA